MHGRREPMMAAVVALLTAALSLLALRRGIGISPDGWRYWQTSVSLLRGQGFIDFYGLPETASPPGYPLYLALWQRFFGVSGATLVLSVVATLGAAGFLWSVFVFRALSGSRPAEPRLAWPGLASIVCVLPATHVFLLSEVLFQAVGFDTTIVPACTARLQEFGDRWLVGPPLYPALERRLDAEHSRSSSPALAAR